MTCVACSFLCLTNVALAPQPKQVQAKFKLQEETLTCLNQTGESRSWSLNLASSSSVLVRSTLKRFGKSLARLIRDLLLCTIFRLGPTNKRQLKLVPVWIRVGRVVNWRLLALLTTGDLCCFVFPLFDKCRVSPPTKTNPSQVQTSRRNSHLSGGVSTPALSQDLQTSSCHAFCQMVLKLQLR